MNLKITKELFIEIMTALKDQSRIDEECSNAFQTILPSDFVTGYDNSRIRNKLIDLLEMAFDDHYKDSTIQYFIYELDFGKKYTEGCISKNDIPIDISTIEKLYDYLVEELEGVKEEDKLDG